MKKLLSIIATMTLCSTTSINLVACNNDKLTFNKTYSPVVEYYASCQKNPLTSKGLYQLIWDKKILMITNDTYEKFKEKLGNFIKDTDGANRTADGTISKINFTYRKLIPVDVEIPLLLLTELYIIEGTRITT